ncbi:MAG: ATP-binding protein [Actinomycetota bacterium]|nr:ATP-binding protein [Actinomycetota bacterium]
MPANNGGVPSRPFVDDLVGRDVLLGRLTALLERSRAGERVTVLVAGQAGIGKTSLVRAAAAVAGEQGARIGWGTCLDVGGAPGYWPWTQLLNGIVRALGTGRACQLAGDDAPLLATIAPSFGDASRWDDSDRARLLLMEATARWLDALATEGPVVVVVDDLQWADESSLALLDFLARSPRPARVCLIGAYRHDELTPPVQSVSGRWSAMGSTCKSRASMVRRCTRLSSASRDGRSTGRQPRSSSAAAVATRSSCASSR